VCQVQVEGNVNVYSDVFVWESVREMLLCTVKCV